LKPVEAARGKAILGDPMTNSKTWVDWPPRQPITIMDLIAEARAVEWDFTNWCYASGHDASDPDARRMFECLLAYAMREGRAGLN
jgi:hypothetical protein